ncbi:MAG: type IV secretion system protein [Alphaproteobacteria bacterium]|nr:type IV secretion system protein [Alphaproteobacteria bacterium]
MTVVAMIVDSAEGFLENAARSTFLGLVEASGTLVGYMAVLAVALVGINMMLQLRPMVWTNCIGLMIKLSLIGIFAWNWNQFWALANSILSAIETTAGGILASSGNGLNGPTITDGFASAIDDMLDSFAAAATTIGREMGGWFGTMIMMGISSLLIGSVAAVSALMILFPKVVITVLLGLAPIMIAMTLFEATKGFFERWLAACISWSLYPLFIASIFSIMLSMGNDMIGRIGTDTYESIGDFLPFIVLMILILLCVALLPTIVGSVSGNLQLLGVVAAGQKFMGGQRTIINTGKGAAAKAAALAQAPGQTLRGENAIGRAGQSFAAHPSVFRATTGVAESINRMQDKARTLGK